VVIDASYFHFLMAQSGKLCRSNRLCGTEASSRIERFRKVLALKLGSLVPWKQHGGARNKTLAGGAENSYFAS